MPTEQGKDRGGTQTAGGDDVPDHQYEGGTPHSEPAVFPDQEPEKPETRPANKPPAKSDRR